MAINDWVILVQDQATSLPEANSSANRKAVYSNTGDTVTLRINSTGTNETGVATTVAPVESIDYDVTPEEHCLEGTIRAGSLDTRLDIEALDVVTIFTKGYRSGESTSIYFPRYRGYCSVAESPHQQDGEPGRFELQGLRQAMYFVDGGVNQEWTGSILEVFHDFLVALRDGEPVTNVFPIGNGAMYNTASVTPDITHSHTVNHNSKNAGEFLDALTNLGGGARIWGVDPYGNISFPTIATDTASYSEGTDGAMAEWRSVQSQGTYSRVRWFLGQGNFNQMSYGHPTDDPPPDIDLTTPDTLTHLSVVDAADPIGLTLEAVPAADSSPLYYLTPSTTPDVTYGFNPGSVTGHSSWVGDTQDASFDMSRVYDGDPLSYIVVEANAVFELEIDGALIDPYEIVAISYSLARSTVDQPVDAYVGLNLGWFDGSFHWTYHNLYGGVPGQAPVIHFVPGFNNIRGEVVFGDRARSDATLKPPEASTEISTRLLVQVDTFPRHIAIADFRLWVIDTGALDDAAAQLVQTTPVSESSQIAVNGEEEPVKEIDFTKLDTTVVSNLPVTSVRYSITGEQGHRTLFNIGPRSSPGATDFGTRMLGGDNRALLRGGTRTLTGFHR